MTEEQKQAKMLVEELLCIDLTEESEERTFTPREGMRTVFTGVFTDVFSVLVDGKAVADTEYYTAFFDKRGGKFSNSIVFKKPVHGDVTIDATWGFCPMPADLQRLLDNAEKVVKNTYQVSKIKSKRVEDFSITYGDLSDDEEFVKSNSVTIAKYSMCDIGYVINGKTCYHGRFCSIC